MNYELALKLKNAGYKQPEHEYYEGRFSCGCSVGIDTESEEAKVVYSCGRTLVYYPTLSELIEACGNEFKKLHKTSTGWSAYAYIYKRGKTAEEAVANLWLELQK